MTKYHFENVLVTALLAGAVTTINHEPAARHIR
jgi:hypothetical protein